MAEPVRLVIWDLDETFWKGTITEGGHKYLRENHDLVMELARRGIMSSICSKNDHQPVENILDREDIWSHFIFPSINWDPKGPRIAALIETVMLRPETVMFIDDNPLNLNEAKHYTPGLQVAGPEILSNILNNPLFFGKNDPALTRLAQYKLLEKRQLDEREIAAKGGSNSNHEFLRSSNIRVSIDFDIQRNIDRAVELVNRTNQLNFTKARLSEDLTTAKAELLALVGDYDIQAGLVRVVDNYGDYGYVGFYAIQTNTINSRLLHYCFSCRTLGMGIETFVYRRIGRPLLPQIVGEVLSDPRDEELPADWITYIHTEFAKAANASEEQKKFGDVVLRGSCDLAAVAHYFEVSARSVTREFFTIRDAGPIQLDHSLFLAHTLDGISNEQMTEFELLGYRREDFTTRLFDPGLQNGIAILSLIADMGTGIYRHKKLGFRVPFVAPAHLLEKPWEGPYDLRDETLAHRFASMPALLKAVSHLRENYEYEGVIKEDLFKVNLHRILAAVSPAVRVFILGANEKWLNPGNNLVYDYPQHAALNTWMSNIIGSYPNASILDVRQFIHSETEAQTVTHFDRMVYFRIYQAIALDFDRGSTQAAMPRTTGEFASAD